MIKDPTNNYIKNGRIDKTAVRTRFSFLITQKNVDDATRVSHAAEFMYWLLSSIGNFYNANVVVSNIKEVYSEEIYYKLKGNKPISIESKNFTQLVGSQMGIDISVGRAKVVHSMFRIIAVDTAPHVTKCSINLLDPVNYISYVYNGGDEVFRLDGEKIVTINNGDEGYLFLGTTQPFRFSQSKVDEGKQLIDNVFEANYDSSQMDPHASKLISQYWFFSSFFRSIISDRPIAIFCGDKGSGKTHLAREMIRLATKPDFVVTTMKRNNNDFYAVVANDNITCFDNFDTATTDEIIDNICSVSTGGGYKARRLYTNLELVDNPVDCFFSFTSRTTKFREDVIDRALMVHMARRRSFGGSSAVKVEDHWDTMRSALLVMLNEMVAQLKMTQNVQAPGSEFRMSEWASFVYRINPKHYNVIISANVNKQKQTNAENCDWVHIFRDIVVSNGFVNGVTAEKLQQSLVQYSKSVAKTIEGSKSTHDLSLTIKKYKDYLKEIGITTSTKRKRVEGVPTTVWTITVHDQDTSHLKLASLKIDGEPVSIKKETHS